MRPLRLPDRGSTLPLMIGFFLLAGLLLTGGVTASAAFLAQRELQSSCDGAAIAAAHGFTRSEDNTGLSFDPDAAQLSVAQYAAEAWGAEAAQVGIDVQVDGDRVIVSCRKTADVPFDDIFAPSGIDQTTVSSANAPPVG